MYIIIEFNSNDIACRNTLNAIIEIICSGYTEEESIKALAKLASDEKVDEFQIKNIGLENKLHNLITGLCAINNDDGWIDAYRYYDYEYNIVRDLIKTLYAPLYSVISPIQKNINIPKNININTKSIGMDTIIELMNYTFLKK